MSKKKKGLDIDTQKIVAWCKSNIVLVILIVVCASAILGLPQLGAGWAEQVEVSLKQRANNFSKMDSLSKTPVTPPGSDTTTNVTVNQALVEEYAEVASSLRGDAEQVVQLATDRNKKNYVVLFSQAPNDLFPTPSKSKEETLPQQFHKQLESEYIALLEEVHAGTPISKEDLVSYLEDARVRFMENNLSTKHDSRLTQEQRSSLEKHLSKVRMARLRTNAEDLSVYLDALTLDIPGFDKTVITVDALFAWQWRYWVIADTIGAVASLNDGQSVLTTPIKRIISIRIAGLPAMEDEFSKDEDKGGRGGAPPGGGSGGRGSGGGGMPTGPGGIPTGPGGSDGGRRQGGSTNSAQASDSFTGRSSGDMFDLIKVQLRCIVDTERIPQILDGFAKYNFFTVVDLDLLPADKFKALSEGFDYGPASVSELTLEFESVWLRSWTTEFMPNGIKQSLGIKVDDK